jgi:hypothetical protein
LQVVVEAQAKKLLAQVSLRDVLFSPRKKRAVACFWFQ